MTQPQKNSLVSQTIHLQPPFSRAPPFLHLGCTVRRACCSTLSSDQDAVGQHYRREGNPTSLATSPRLTLRAKGQTQIEHIIPTRVIMSTFGTNVSIRPTLSPLAPFSELPEMTRPVC
eukprot:1767733-Amphidinium_carterae.1